MGRDQWHRGYEIRGTYAEVLPLLRNLGKVWLSDACDYHLVGATQEMRPHDGAPLQVFDHIVDGYIEFGNAGQANGVPRIVSRNRGVVRSIVIVVARTVVRSTSALGYRNASGSGRERLRSLGDACGRGSGRQAARRGSNGQNAVNTTRDGYERIVVNSDRHGIGDRYKG